MPATVRCMLVNILCVCKCLTVHGVALDVNPVIGIQSAAGIKLTLSAPFKSCTSHISITGVIVSATYLLQILVQLWKNKLFVMHILGLDVETQLATFISNGVRDHQYHHLHSFQEVTLSYSLNKESALLKLPTPLTDSCILVLHFVCFITDLFFLPSA